MGSQYRPQARDARELEAGLPVAQSEKAGLTSTPSTHPEPRDHPQQSMLTPRRLFLGLAVCLVLWLGLTTAAPTRQNSCLPPHDVKDASSGSAQAPLPDPIKDMASSTQTESPFACLMDAVSPEALHEVLHRYFPNRFKDGVYESDHSAMEAVHRADPPLATSLARIARRQNGTAPGPTTSTTATPPVDNNTPTAQLPRVTPTPNTTPSVSTTSTTRSQSSNPVAHSFQHALLLSPPPPFLLSAYVFVMPATNPRAACRRRDYDSSHQDLVFNPAPTEAADHYVHVDRLQWRSHRRHGHHLCPCRACRDRRPHPGRRQPPDERCCRQAPRCGGRGPGWCGHWGPVPSLDPFGLKTGTRPLDCCGSLFGFFSFFVLFEKHTGSC
ncbi:hypothetical protein RB601_004980 [Gaeumannomyces tritici]